MHFAKYDYDRTTATAAHTCTRIYTMYIICYFGIGLNCRACKIPNGFEMRSLLNCIIFIKQTKRTTFSREYLHKTMLSMPTIYSISHQKSHLSHWCAILIRIIITNSRVCIGGTVRFAVALNKRANFKHPKHNSNFEFGYIYNRDDGISISSMSYMSFYFKLFDSFA